MTNPFLNYLLASFQIAHGGTVPLSVDDAGLLTAAWPQLGPFRAGEDAVEDFAVNVYGPVDDFTAVRMGYALKVKGKPWIGLLTETVDASATRPDAGDIVRACIGDSLAEVADRLDRFAIAARWRTARDTPIVPFSEKENADNADDITIL